MQYTVFLILPRWAGVSAFSLPADSAYITFTCISTNGKQPETNTDLLYFSGLSYYKSSVEANFPIIAIASPHQDFCANVS